MCTANKQHGHVEVATHISQQGRRDPCSTSPQESSLHLRQCTGAVPKVLTSLESSSGLRRAKNCPPPADHRRRTRCGLQSRSTRLTESSANLNPVGGKRMGIGSRNSAEARRQNRGLQAVARGTTCQNQNTALRGYAPALRQATRAVENPRSMLSACLMTKATSSPPAAHSVATDSQKCHTYEDGPIALLKIMTHTLEGNLSGQCVCIAIVF